MTLKKILFLTFVLNSGMAFCTTVTIVNSGFTFSPASVTITVGDSVKFTLASNHNAVEVSQATWNANGNTALPGFSTSFGGGLVLPAQLTVGTHYYVCSPHASLGMKGEIIVLDIAGIQENQLDANVSIFPNPTRGKFTLTVDGKQTPINKLDLEIYNLAGQKIYQSTNMPAQQSIIDLESESRGIYFIRIKTEQGTNTKKITIVR